MTAKMAYGAERPLTDGEWAALSDGLAAALANAGVEPRIVARPALGARIAALWRGGATPTLAWKQTLYWPDALQDFAAPDAWRDMALLQHELHHLWEYAVGDLTWFSYGLDPRNWRYRYRLTPRSRWSDFGAEQRASIAEHLWLIDHGHMSGADDADLRRHLLPWRHLIW
ncbi:hypothetical protein [Phenylobacterium immobile]|uniref:hypothetical protein n=1 Tax=Phenylobacterium immobile TaxID=21 RepID=UPI000A9B860F|nr:hypothetical protein [Phenylobacterium immobile]